MEAKLELLGFVGVQVEHLVSKRRSAGRDCAVVVIVDVHVQLPGVLIPLVEGNTHLNNVLRLLEVVRDAASLIGIRASEDIPLTRPARVGFEVVVSAVVGYAAVWAAATS